ncbi:hypothetical protein FQN60_009717 [Etheostoma spectabile]|uniref:Uncharacterized protein n=1 Tax=Etheostoma spectabile TaxID=54343 RepID=A0A5J5DJZ3_9PERO|nr:hypothetical protein FQN60_009717 [Etheostoma spectabile]
MTTATPSGQQSAAVLQQIRSRCDRSCARTARTQPSLPACLSTASERARTQQTQLGHEHGVFLTFSTSIQRAAAAPIRDLSIQSRGEERKHCSRHAGPAPHHTDRCDAFRLGSSQRVIPLNPSAARLYQDEGPAQPHFIRELVRTKRHSVHELVRAQPHLVHDMGWPEIHETSRSQGNMDGANSSQLNPLPSASQDVARTRPAVEENQDVEDEMERMVHLVVPQDADSYRGRPDSSDPEKDLLGGPGAGDASLEASGFYGTDTEDRDRGEEGGEHRERRGGEDEWDRDTGEDGERREGNARAEEEERGGRDDADVHVVDVNHTSPDLDALIGYSPSSHPSSSPPAEVHDLGLQEHRAPPVLEENGRSSGYGLLHSSITTTSATSTAAPASTAAAAAAGTATHETDTGTDFGLLGNETEDEETERKEEEEEETGLAHKGDVFTQNPTVAEVGVAPSREPLQPSVEEEEEQELKEKWRKLEEEETRVRHIVPLTTDPSPTIGFTDPSWGWLGKTRPLQTLGSDVRGGGVTEVFLPDFDELDEAQQVVCVDWSELAGRGYVILNMTENLNCEEFRVDQGVRLLKVMERVFARRMNSPEGSWVLYLSKPTHHQHQLLMNVGIQNYSSASSCQSRPSQTRSDYGKLFVVLVIIGSVCMFRAEELHFVENGCHDNPMLDVTNDNQPEMQEKKPSTNGLAAGGEGGGEEGSRWQVFVNHAATEEEEEEQDTHL